MRILGYEIRKAGKAGKPPRPASRPSVVNPFDSAFSSYTPGTADLELYRAIKEGIPIVDAAIDKLVHLVGGVSVEPASAPGGPKPRGRVERRELGVEGKSTHSGRSFPRLSTLDSDLFTVTDSINGFLETVRVNAFQSGFDAFLTNFLNDLLTYGRAAGEIVLDNARRDVFGLVNIDSRTLRISRPENVFESEIAQVRTGSMGVPQSSDSPFVIKLNRNLILYGARSQEGDDPNGVSLLRSLPFVSQVLIRIHSSIGFAWERFGDPTYVVTYVPRAEFADDSELTKTNRIASDLSARWKSAMEARHSNTAREDLVSVGDVRIQAVGADGQVLSAQVPNRVILEQITARLGIPPFMLGIAWSTTERMAIQQTETLISEIQGLRKTLEPIACKLIDTWLNLRGIPTKGERPYELVWPDVILHDAVSRAQARLLEARAREIESRVAGGDSPS